MLIPNRVPSGAPVNIIIVDYKATLKVVKIYMIDKG